MRYLLVLAAFLSFVVFPPVVSAWDCQHGFKDTLVNQQNGKCVEHKPPTPTAAPAHTHIPTPKPLATNTPQGSPPSGGSPSGGSSPSGSSGGHTVAICHYEPSTGNSELRHVQPDQVENRLKQGDTLPTDSLCAQSAEVTLPATVTAVASIVAPIFTTATPTPVEIVISQEATPAPTSTPMTENIESTPITEISVPSGLPDTGDGSTYEESMP